MSFLSHFLQPIWAKPSYRLALDRFRDQRLRELVRHAGAHVPYYRAKFAASGLDTTTFRGLEDLGRIPISGKNDLQPLSPTDLCAEGIDPETLVVHETGGSTGQPFTVRRTKMEDGWLQWLRWRVRHAVGMRPSDRSARIGYIEPSCRWRQESPLASRFGLNRYHLFDCKQQPETLREAVTAYAPHVLMGFPSALCRLALAEMAATKRELWPRLILCGAELLTPQSRDLLREVFRCPVLSLYGAHEFNLLAWECPQTGFMHGCDEGVILEILDAQGRPVASGETGEVVGTALHSFAMPIIRYHLGDLATRGEEPCPCGHLLPVLSMVRGRQLDYFKLAGGRWLHPYEIIDSLYGSDMEWVGQYQLIQETEDRIRLLVRPRGPVGVDRIDHLAAVVQARCGHGISATVELVDDIPSEANGKYRVSLSKVATQR